MSSENQEVVTPEVSTDAPVLSGDPKTETPETNIDWKANLSDEIKSDKSLENIKDIEGLAKSYVHAQKLVGSDKIPVPNKYATEDDWNAVYEKLGRPKDATGYKYELGEDANINQDALKSFSDQAHKLGLLPTQANGIVKFYNDMAAQQQQDLDTTAENARQESETSLKKEWGQAYKQQTKKSADVALQVFDEDFLNKNLADGTKIGDHPSFIKAFATLADKMGEDTITQASGPAYQTPAQIEKEIGELTKEGSSYWDKRHPNHDLAVKEVLALREQKNSV
jgi:hypothetical protein|tara:strand:- start:1622 stop:2464 length:843 start_codon:yes stop_codon:yes gene_type:complete